MSVHALYRFFNRSGELLYVGITLNPGNRWAAHRDDKSWWQEVSNITLETHPDRDAVLEAEMAAIRSERPKYNLMHNRDSRPRPPRPPSSASRGQWVFSTRRSGYERQCDLYLYPELDCSSMVDDYWDLDGAGQLEAYIRYIERKYPQFFADDAVPIYWSVRSNPEGVFEAAPSPLQGRASMIERAERKQAGLKEVHEDFLTYFNWPENVETGELLDWYSLPVLNNRFAEFAKALAWTPSPLQPTCPLASILRSRRGVHP